MVSHQTRSIFRSRPLSVAREQKVLPPWVRTQLRAHLALDTTFDEEALVGRALERLRRLDPELGDLVYRQMFPGADGPVDPKTWRRAKLLFLRYLKMELVDLSSGVRTC